MVLNIESINNIFVHTLLGKQLSTQKKKKKLQLDEKFKLLIQERLNIIFIHATISWLTNSLTTTNDFEFWKSPISEVSTSGPKPGQSYLRLKIWCTNQINIIYVHQQGIWFYWQTDSTLPVRRVPCNTKQRNIVNIKTQETNVCRVLL